MQFQSVRFFRSVAVCGMIGAAAAGIVAFSRSAPYHAVVTAMAPPRTTADGIGLTVSVRRAAGALSDIRIGSRGARHSKPAVATIELSSPSARIAREAASAITVRLVSSTALQFVELHISPTHASRRAAIMILEGLAAGLLAGALFGWLRGHLRRTAPLHA
jgi:hypothetical protein